MTLVADIRHAWKWLGVQLGAVLAIMPEIYENADILADYVPQKTFHHVMAGLGILVIWNSVRKKKKK